VPFVYQPNPIFLHYEIFPEIITLTGKQSIKKWGWAHIAMVRSSRYTYQPFHNETMLHTNIQRLHLYNFSAVTTLMDRKIAYSQIYILVIMLLITCYYILISRISLIFVSENKTNSHPQTLTSDSSFCLIAPNSSYTRNWTWYEWLYRFNR